MKFDPFKIIRTLQADNAKLRHRIADLERQNREYLHNWVRAQDLAYNRQVFALAGKVLTADGQAIDPLVKTDA